MITYCLVVFVALLVGVVAGSLIENYRARVMWGFDLGPEWRRPPGDRS